MALMNLNKKLDRLDNSVSRKRNGKRRWPVKLFVILLVLFVILYLPARGVYIASKEVVRGGRLISQGAKSENLDTIKTGIDETKTAVEALHGSLNWLFWLGFIPFFGGYYSDARHLAIAGEYELSAAQTIVATLEPYKQEIGLTGQPIPGQDRIAQMSKVLDKVLPQVDKIEPNLKKARLEVEDIDTGKYPESFGSTKLRGRIQLAKDFIMGADIAVSDNKSALEVLPSFLGEPTPKSYLVLFQNDKELRATGGFITAYTFLKLDHGHLSTTGSDDIYRLDERLLKVCLNKICPLAPPVPIVKYLPEANGKPRTAWSMRDSNLSPDFPTSARQFESMYNLLGDSNSFDGIITIDTNVVEDLIAITGPVDIYGTTYSANTDKRCNCPNVIYELEHYAEIASKGEPDRKAVLGTLMQQILARSLGSGADKMPDFVTTGITLANDKHIMFYMHDDKTEEALKKLNWAGGVKDTDGDYLHINDSNFAGGKSNLYVDERVTYDILVDSNGNAKNKVTIEYKNPQPFNTWLNGILRDYVRVYVPKGSSLVSSNGSDDPVNTQMDDGLNKTYFDAFITVRPQNSRILSFEYTLPNKVSGHSYPLLIQKQPGAKDCHYTIKINDRTKEDFNLTTDKQLNLTF